MRILATALLLASPAAAWEASAIGPVCYLTHSTDEADVTVSHDPRRALPYAITIDRKEAWKAGPLFAIQFDGPGGRMISTERHQLSDDNRALSVEDLGFDNVLDGFAQNFLAIAMSGNTTMVIPLLGAAPEVERFRDCAAPAGV